MEDILRLEPSHSLGFQAKDGGPPRCRPVLCGLRDRCIAAMLATQRDRDAKAELNRRGQACEIPGRHRDFAPRKWLAGSKPRRRLVGHQGIAPCTSAWKVLADGHGMYLSTLMPGEKEFVIETARKMQ